MCKTIVILDDEPDRILAMQNVLDAHYAHLTVETFDNAPDLNAWFAEHLTECRLICLDHDLGPNRSRNDELFDPGIGRDVADYLATCQPQCPILIHTTNTEARPGMILALEDAGWEVSYVSPYADTLWIFEVWKQAIKQYLTEPE